MLRSFSIHTQLWNNIWISRRFLDWIYPKMWSETCIFRFQSMISVKRTSSDRVELGNVNHLSIYYSCNVICNAVNKAAFWWPKPRSGIGPWQKWRNGTDSFHLLLLPLPGQNLIWSLIRLNIAWWVHFMWSKSQIVKYLTGGYLQNKRSPKSSTHRSYHLSIKLQ